MKLNCLTEDDIKVFIKSGQAVYTVLLDKEDFDSISKEKLIVVKQRGYATVNICLNGKCTNKKSLGKVILNTDKNVYLKNRRISECQFVLDYRKSNLSTDIKDIVGYCDIARENFFKHKNKIFKERHKSGYQVDVANKIMKKKSGEKNYSAKLTDDDIKAIRENYIPGVVTQSSLAKQYGVSRSTISSIVTYKRWRNHNIKDIKSLYKKSIIRLNKKKEPKQHLSYFDFKDSKYLYLENDKLFYYIEKINDEGLIYLEIRDNLDSIVVRSDLLFGEELNKQTKREYSIASKYPVRTPINDIVYYVDKLKEYI